MTRHDTASTVARFRTAPGGQDAGDHARIFLWGHSERAHVASVHSVETCSPRDSTIWSQGPSRRRGRLLRSFAKMEMTTPPGSGPGRTSGRVSASVVDVGLASAVRGLRGNRRAVARHLINQRRAARTANHGPFVASVSAGRATLA